MDNTNTTTVTLKVNGEDAKNKISQLLDQITTMRQRLGELSSKPMVQLTPAQKKEVKDLTRSITQTEKELRRMQSSAQAADHVLSQISTANLKELKTTLRDINRELNSSDITRGSDRWNQLTAKAREVKAEIAKVNEELKATRQLNQDTEEQKSWLRSFGDKWQGLVVTLGGVKDTISSLTSTVMGYYEQYAQMAEHMTNVKKYTGLADEAVKSLNEDFMRMDTRTSREQLNDLAADAGRLGIQSKQQILDFVQAADQLNVALGEDLGEDGVKNIGKLAQLFGDSDRMGLKQAMLSTGSVINELAQSSSASEGYLMEFTARLAGVGKQAGLTQAQIMAFGSILDQSMVGVEKGATALQNVIVALFAKPEKMAKAAGLEVKQFTQLLKTDANAAVLQFVQALQNSGGFDSLAPLLKEMQLSGSGVTQTLSALANNLDALKATQQQATQAFQDGTSVTNEFNTANNTAQAELEKAEKQARDMAVTLGEMLKPAVTGVLSVSKSIMQALITIIPFITKNIGAIAKLAAVITTYTVIAKAAVIQTKLVAVAQAYFNLTLTVGRSAMAAIRYVGALWNLCVASITGNTIKAKAAQDALNKSMLKNPYALITTLLLAAGIALYELCNRTDELTERQKAANKVRQELMDAQKEATDSTAKEKLRIETLTNIIHDNSRSIAERKNAINDLRKIVPAYHGEINKEGKLIRDNTGAIMDYIDQLDKMALAQALYNKMVKAMEEQVTADLAVKHWQKTVAWRQNQNNTRTHNTRLEASPYMPGGGGQSYTVIDDDEKALRMDQQRLAYWQERERIAANTKKAYMQYAKDHGIDKQVESLQKGEGQTVTPKAESSITTSKGETEAERKAREKREKQLKKEEAERLRKQKEANKAAEKEYDRAAVKLRQSAMNEYAIGKTDLLAYREQINAIAEQTIEKKRDIYTKDSEEWKKHNDDLIRLQEAHAKQSQDWSIEDLNRKEKAELQQAAMDNAKGLTTEEAYQEQRNRITVDYLQRRMNLYKEYGRAEDFERTREQLTDTLNTQKLEKQKSYMEKLNTLRQEYEQKSATERMQIELQMLQAVYQATDETGKRISTMTEAEYNRLKKLINLKYLGPDGKVNTDGTITPGTTGEAHDDLQSKADKALSQARSTKGQEIKPVDTATDWGFSSITSAAYKLSAQKETYDNLKKMRADDLIDEQTYQEACKKLDQERFTNLTALAEAAYSSIGAIMSSASSLFTAQQQLEETRVTKRYDAEIKAAGSTTKKGKKLEEQKQKELAQIKTKYNKKQMKIELAQAVATTAMNALKAYGAMADIPVVGPALGAIAAAAAIAAGAIQIASIKKQHAAEQEGYYSGGYTGGNNYRQTAGIVHQGEFVANHQAVLNPAIRPVLDLIDTAQRTNRIARLTPADVSRAILAPQATAAATSATAAAATQTAAATTQTAATAPHTTQIITTTTQAQTDTLRRLADQLDQGIRATVTIDGPDGLDRQYRKYQRLNNI